MQHNLLVSEYFMQEIQTKGFTNVLKAIIQVNGK